MTLSQLIKLFSDTNHCPRRCCLSFEGELQFQTYLNRRYTDRESCASFLLPLVDELKQPGDSTGYNTQTLKGVIAAYHGVGFTWKRQNRGSHLHGLSEVQDQTHVWMKPYVRNNNPSDTHIQTKWRILGTWFTLWWRRECCHLHWHLHCLYWVFPG